MKVGNKEKILILTGNYGDGHIQVAQALHDAIQISHPSAEPVIFDFMEWVHPYSNQFSRFIYLQGVKKFPQVYGFLFQKTRKVNKLSMCLKTILTTGVGRMVKLLEEVQPSVVVSTFPLAAAVMSKVKSLGLTEEGVVTMQYALEKSIEKIYNIEPVEIDARLMGSDENKNIMLYFSYKLN